MMSGQLETKPHCPSCNKLLDGFTGVQAQEPKVGSVSICIYCRELLVFDGDPLTVIKAEGTIREDMIADPKILKILNFLEQYERAVFQD